VLVEHQEPAVLTRYGVPDVPLAGVERDLLGRNPWPPHDGVEVRDVEQHPVDGLYEQQAEQAHGGMDQPPTEVDGALRARWQEVVRVKLDLGGAPDREHHPHNHADERDPVLVPHQSPLPVQQTAEHDPQVVECSVPTFAESDVGRRHQGSRRRHHECEDRTPEQHENQHEKGR
jgi:hypothetical protein